MILPYGDINNTTGVVCLIKRVIRRMLRWLLLPLFDEVNRQETEIEFAKQQLLQQSAVLKVLQQQVIQQSLSLETAQKQIMQHTSVLDLVQAEFSQQSAMLSVEQQQIMEHTSVLDSIQEQYTQQGVALCIAQQQIVDMHKREQVLKATLEKGTWFPKEVRGSSSQAGEDQIINYVFSMLGIQNRCRNYLDLGANHAVALSNTYGLYKAGACGVLVEANPLLISELEQQRPDDIVLNRCVSGNNETEMDFFILSGDGLSTPDKHQVEIAIAENPALTIDQTVSVKSISVNEIMDMYFDGGAPMFMNIDIEGNELDILQSIDFEKHRPLVIALETIPYRVGLFVGQNETELIAFLESHDYLEYAFTGINSIFLDKRKFTLADSAVISYQDVYDGEEDLTCKMHTTNTSRRIRGLQAFSGEVIFGPYITLSEGLYRFSFEVELPNGIDEISCQVTADGGKMQIAEFLLHCGKNYYELLLTEHKKDLEFVIRNTLSEGKVVLMHIRIMQLIHNREMLQ